MVGGSSFPREKFLGRQALRHSPCWGHLVTSIVMDGEIGANNLQFQHPALNSVASHAGMAGAPSPPPPPQSTHVRAAPALSPVPMGAAPVWSAGQHPNLQPPLHPAGAGSVYLQQSVGQQRAAHQPLGLDGPWGYAAGLNLQPAQQQQPMQCSPAYAGLPSGAVNSPVTPQGGTFTSDACITPAYAASVAPLPTTTAAGGGGGDGLTPNPSTSASPMPFAPSSQQKNLSSEQASNFFGDMLAVVSVSAPAYVLRLASAWHNHLMLLLIQKAGYQVAQLVMPTDDMWALKMMESVVAGEQALFVHILSGLHPVVQHAAVREFAAVHYMLQKFPQPPPILPETASAESLQQAFHPAGNCTAQAGNAAATSRPVPVAVAATPVVGVAASPQPTPASTTSPADDAATSKNSAKSKDAGCVPSSKKGLGTRTPAETYISVMAKPSGQRLDESLVLPGFPRGPLDMSRSSLLHTINAFTNRAECPGGGFKVTMQRSVKNAADQIVKQCFRCNGGCNTDDDGSDARGCNFEVNYEWTTEGWALTRWSQDEKMISIHSPSGSVGKTTQLFATQHRHRLLTDRIDARAQHGRLPGLDSYPQLCEIASAMSEAGQPCKNTLNVLLHKLERMNEDTSIIDYQYVYNKWYRESAAAQVFDLSDMLEWLKTRKEETGLTYEMHVDKLGFVDAVFWENDGGAQEWSYSVSDNVLLFDPTHGTNRHGLKLCCFVGVSHTGHNVILANLMVEKEARWYFEWGFRCFAATFRTPPKLVFTDRDEEIAEAIKSMQSKDIWPKIVHLLCVFHISVSLYKHLHALFAGNTVGWKEFHDYFWRVVKATDLARTLPQGPGSWRCDTEQLVDLVLTHVKESPLRDHEVEWLKGLLAKGQQYAARFTWDHGSCGIHSTQRAEANQAKVKVCC